MQQNVPHKFKALIHIIGINPFVFVPPKILKQIFKQVGRDKGPIPIKGNINSNAYKQTLVRYSNEWRLYINTTILKNSPKRIGEKIEITIELDSTSRDFDAPVNFVKALKANKEAAINFEQLTPSRKQEIVRYLARLKTKESLERNIVKAIGFLMGKEKFVGRVLVPDAQKINQQKHSPHEAWHVVEQKQGRVKPTANKSANPKINDDTSLEKEADAMGAKAIKLIQKKKRGNADL